MSRERSSGFQRGFLLSGSSSRRRRTTRPNLEGTKNSSLQSLSSLESPNNAKPAVSSSKNSKTACGVKKSNSGWAKGFLTKSSGGQKTNSTAVIATAASNDASIVETQARGAAKPTKTKKDSGWKKGFLTQQESNRNPTNQSGNFEASFQNESTIPRRQESISSPTNLGNPTARKKETRVGVTSFPLRTSDFLLSMENDTDTKTKRSNNSPIIKHKSLISVIHEEDAATDLELSGDEGPPSQDNPQSILSEDSLMTPLLSVGKNGGGESEFLMKEVSTTRTSAVHALESLGSFGGDHPDPYQNPVESTNVKLTDSKNPDSLARASDPREGILQFQQNLERMFSKCQQEGRGDTETQNSKSKMVRSWSREQRRCAWLYLLRKRQYQRDHRQTAKDVLLLHNLLSELLDAEYYNPDEMQHPLETILQCVETEEDRMMSLQAILVVQENCTRLSKNLEKSLDARPEVVLHGIPRLSSVLARLATVSGRRRTRLAQQAWEAAILLKSIQLKMLPSTTDAGFMSKEFWEELSACLHQQLDWQQSKRKPSERKTSELKRIELQSRRNMKVVQEEGDLESIALSVPTFVRELERLLKH